MQFQKNISLARFTTYKTGGPAEFFAEAKCWEDMLEAREFAQKEGLPMMILGGGSNVLIADEGIPGLVIHNKMTGVQFEKETVTAESGVNLMKLLLLAAEQNLGGISGLANVPGSVGGAVYGNAGIPGLWMENVLMLVTILPENENAPRVLSTDQIEFSYRESSFKKNKDIILAATLSLKPCPKAMVRDEINAFIQERAKKQPAGNSCGSFFKNPEGFTSSGWLIEQSGCKGMKIGGAQVSEKHANFFMNTGNATSADILKLATKVQGIVEEKFGVKLEPEVQIIPKNPLK